MSIYRFSSVVILFGSIVSCGAANFTGGSKTSPKFPTEKPGTTGTTPGGTTPGGTTPGGTTPGGTTPGADGGSTPQIGPDNQVNQPNPNTIVYGIDQVFHIGDGRFEGTSCKQEVSQLALAGNAYFFEFEVLTDSTQMTIDVAKLCGIDYTTNTYELYSGRSVVQGLGIPLVETKLTSPRISLNKGVYTIILAAGFGAGAGQSRKDLDDYIVGSVTVNGSKPVKSVRYGSYNR